MIRQSDPVSLAQYFQKHELLRLLGWNRFKACDRIQKRVNRMVKQAKLYSRRTAKKLGFRVEVPRDWNDTAYF